MVDFSFKPENDAYTFKFFLQRLSIKFHENRSVNGADAQNWRFKAPPYLNYTVDVIQ